MERAPFVVLCAMVPEAAPARLGLYRARSSGRLSLVGMGPSSARKAAARLASVVPDDVPVVVLGVGGALVPGLVPGDLVVASAFGTADATGEGGSLEVSRPPEALDARSSAFADQLAAALSGSFGSTRLAPLLSAARTAKGGEREHLGTTSGAVICDTESYWLARLAERRPFGVVRAVVDTPERELLSKQTITGGITGLRKIAAVSETLARSLESSPRRDERRPAGAPSSSR